MVIKLEEKGSSIFFFDFLHASRRCCRWGLRRGDVPPPFRLLFFLTVDLRLNKFFHHLSALHRTRQ